MCTQSTCSDCRKYKCRIRYSFVVTAAVAALSLFLFIIPFVSILQSTDWTFKRNHLWVVHTICLKRFSFSDNLLSIRVNVIRAYIHAYVDVYAAPVRVFQKSFLSTRENVISHAFKWNETQLKWLLDNASKSVCWVVLVIHFKPKIHNHAMNRHTHTYTFRTFQQLIQRKSIFCVDILHAMILVKTQRKNGKGSRKMVQN